LTVGKKHILSSRLISIIKKDEQKQNLSFIQMTAFVMHYNIPTDNIQRPVQLNDPNETNLSHSKIPNGQTSSQL
jgi:hypothetical protein